MNPQKICLSLLISFTVLVIRPNAIAQNTIVGTTANTEIYNQLLKTSFEAYDLIEVDINRSDFTFGNEVPTLNMILGNKTIEMSVFPNNIKLGFKPKIKPHLLSGHTRQGGVVSLTIADDFLYGFIKEGSSEYFVEPLRHFDSNAPKNLMIGYYAHQVIINPEHKCGVEATQIKNDDPIPEKMIIDECQIVNYAIANTYDMVTELGNVAAVELHNMAVINNVQTNYRSEFDINLEYFIVDIFVPATSGADPFSSTNDANILLNNVNSWGDGGGNNSGSTGGFGVNYYMAALWTDRDIQYQGGFGTVGLASTPGFHHVLENYSTNAAQLRGMVSHEIGHNWSYGHDAGGSPFIMAPFVTLTDDWSTASKNSINNYIGNINYLADCSTKGAPVANFFQGGGVISCVGGTTSFEDQSQYGATRVWDFNNGTPASAIDEKTSSTFNTAGKHYVKITSSNAAGSDVFTGFVDVQLAPNIPCMPSSASGGNGGITNVGLVSIANASDDAAAAGRYEDFACEHVTELSANTDYFLFVTIQATLGTNFRHFIDYNGDGDFNDPNESSPEYGIPGAGNYNIPLNTVANPMQDQLLRMRIISDTGVSNSCENPTYGQVEDYGVYFSSGTVEVLGCTDPTASNYNPNATIDDGSCATTFYVDSDQDTFGDPANSLDAPSQPTGYVVNSSDCNDNDNTVFPGAPELCDGQINNCNSAQLPGNEIDNDGDGYVECIIDGFGWDGVSSVVGGNDCDDMEGLNFPTNDEICDGIDNNCNGMIDEGCEPCDAANLNITSLTQATYRAEVDLASDAYINSPLDILFAAGNDLDFDSGFEVTSGTNFSALVLGCLTTLFMEEDNEQSKQASYLQIKSIVDSFQFAMEENSILSLSILDQKGQEIIEVNTENQNHLNLLVDKLYELNQGVYLLTAKNLKELKYIQLAITK